jgi:hypothetical protein
MEDSFKREAQNLLKANPDTEIVYATADGNLFLQVHYAYQHAKTTGQEVIEFNRKDLPFVKETMHVATKLPDKPVPVAKKNSTPAKAKKVINKKK